MKNMTLEKTSVTGLSIRTTSETAGADIGGLWQAVAERGLLAGQGVATAVYHQYVVKEQGYEVTVTVGIEGLAEQTGLDTVVVPEQKVARFDTDGSVEAVTGVWMAVWQRWPDGGPRTFVADVERWKVGPTGQMVGADVLIGVHG